MDDVSDSPEFTLAEMAAAKPFAEAFPELAAWARRVSGPIDLCSSRTQERERSS